MTVSQLPQSKSPQTPTRRENRGKPSRSTRTWRAAVLNYLAFILRRLGFGVLVLLFIIYLSYLGLEMASGESLGQSAPQALENTLYYLGRAFQGDLGVTTAGSNTMIPRPVPEVLRERVPRSLGLLAISLAFSALVGILLGFAAARSRRLGSLGILLTTLIGVSVPSFLAAFLLQWAVTSYTRAAGRAVLPVGGFGWDAHLVLPALVLAARPIAQITRITFVTVREVYAQDYVRTAFSKGLHPYSIMWSHVLRNVAIPVLTTIMVSLRYSLSSLPVVELYFGWPGAGFSLLKGISQQDYNLTIALTVSLGLLIILINLILELSYRMIDPRLLQPAQQSARQTGIFGDLRQAWSDLVQIGRELSTRLTETPLIRRLLDRSAEEAQTGWQMGELQNGASNTDTGQRQAVPLWRLYLRNFPLAAGSLLVFGLITLIFVGPLLAPNNPYSTQGLVRIDGQLTPPPFAPNETFPWGTDALGRGILSLLLAGAQQTLVLALLVVGVRSLIGIGLGAIAGWRNDGLADRMILGLAEILAAFPTLLLAMILILALGIRQGMPPFIIGLGLVGWGETMQFVRSEVISLRPKLFVESAVAIGARTLRIVARHIMPNLFSALISIVALEMGAVLMLLGELGFIGIFIGGGALIELPSMTVHYSDVPEWGALLSNIRYLARSYPWTALYPMLAFFISIVSFNLLGEGIRQMLEEGNLLLNRLFNRYTFGLAVVIVVGFNWFQANSGPVPFYRQRASEFSGAEAYRHTALLSDSRLEGRALGSSGMDLAALYIGREFNRLGLQPGGEAGSYFYTRKHSFGRINSQPVLVINDQGPALQYGQDYAAYPGRNINQGIALGPVRVIALGERITSATTGFRRAYPDLDRADFSDSIILTFSDTEAAILSNIAMKGMLVVTEDPDLLSRRYTFSSRSGTYYLYFAGQTRGANYPSIWISPSTANRILAAAGSSLTDIQRLKSELASEQVYQLPLDIQVGIEVQGEAVSDQEVKHVIGLLPGTSGMQGCQTCLGHKLIVVMAQYDSPPIGPEGAYQAANNNASGIGLMLEAVRALTETDYQPYKSLLFIAYSGEGLDGGEPVSNPDINRFLLARTGFTNFEVEAVIRLRGVGAGAGSRIEVTAGGSLRLAELFERAARQMDAQITRAEGTIDISTIYSDGNPFLQSGQEAPELQLFWEGWQAYNRLPGDTIEKISADDLETIGETLTFSLMTLGRETEY